MSGELQKWSRVVAPGRDRVEYSSIRELLNHSVLIVSLCPAGPNRYRGGNREFVDFAQKASNCAGVPLSESDALLYLDRVLGPLCEVLPTLDLCRSAISLAARWKFSFYDSVIIAAAIQGKCQILYSKDLHHGQNVEGVNVVNPFLSYAD